MKKFLHGRRHLRARASVRAGRDKRFMRKYNQTIRVLNRIDWYGIGMALADAVQKMTAAAAAMAPIMQREVQRINSSRQLLIVENAESVPADIFHSIESCLSMKESPNGLS